jgi:hypothetical protein
MQSTVFWDEFPGPCVGLSCEDNGKMNRREVSFDEACWVKVDYKQR